MRWLAVLLGAIAGVIAATQPLADTDMWWHLATGRETLAHGIVGTDVFSWTVFGSPISTDQWLGQTLMWCAYDVLGWRGVSMLRVVLVVALVSFVGLAATRHGRRPLAVVLATLPALLLTRALWVDRPELFGLVLFAAVLMLLRRARDGSRPAMLATVGLIGIWVNVHGSFALGVTVTVLSCAERALRDRAQRRDYAVFAVAALAVTLINPSGLAAWTAPGMHLVSPPRDIQEWNIIDLRTPLGVGYGLVLAALFACAFLGPRLDARELVVLLPVALLSLTAARQAPLLAIVAVPLFAERATLLLDRLRLAPPRSSRPLPRALAIGVPLLLIYTALWMSPTDPDQRAYPVAAVASIPLGDHTLARYEWGGFLIWSGVPVFVDGRLTPYSGGVLEDYQRIIAAKPGWRDTVARRGVRALLVAPSDPVAARAIDLGWPVRARSDTFVVITVP